jgi:uncharacterized protein (DUF488 family)
VLTQGSVDQVRKQEIPRVGSHIVIAMCFYPRQIKKEWRDDSITALGPDRTLFNEWKSWERQVGHEAAFAKVNYEARFTPTPIALYQLKKLAEISLEKNVFLICQCQVGERCHREMLMLCAREKYGAAISEVFNQYPVFSTRIAGLDDEIKLW